MGLGLALAINTAVPGARYCMSAMFLTNLMPIIAVCLVWRFLLHPYGLVNQLLAPFGVGRIDWLTDSRHGDAGDHRRHGVAVRALFHGGLPGRAARHPRRLLRGRRSSTAPAPLRRFWHVTLPLLSPIIFFVVVVSACCPRASS